MKNIIEFNQAVKLFILTILSFFLISCNKETTPETKKEVSEKHEFFNLRPKIEKQFGYTHSVKIGNDLKISGAVSMDNDGKLLGEGDMDVQMKNCYSDLDKILKHYGYTFEDVTVENIYTTNMAGFQKVSGYRSSIYKIQFPTGTWSEVKRLALPGQLIEIEMEAHKYY